MRLFVALLLSEEMKDVLCQSQTELRNHARSGNFSRRENLHLTLAFLGDCPPSAVARIRRAMNGAAAESSPFSITLRGLGRFRRPGADLWWAGLEKEIALTHLADSLRRELKGEGLTLDEKPFSPHLTLARQVDAPGLRPEDIPQERVSQPVVSMSLMESTRVNGVLTYREILSVSLGKPV